MGKLLAPFLHSTGLALLRHRKAIQLVQWFVVLSYIFLLVTPVFLNLPPQQAHILDNLVLFAQFVFWGIWWPFVILSMLLFGRLWCGIFCPEGTLTEWTSTKGRNKTIPRWLKWRGWPTVAFMLTTLYGQLISVYDYAQAALLILGGSTTAAMVTGYFYGRGTRIWCRYLCPVSGVFNLLSRLSPISFKTDEQRWQAYAGPKQPATLCPVTTNIRQLHGVSACHMCGRCAGYRQAVTLEPRPCNEEILVYGAEKNSIWEARLLLYGMIGLAIGAFTWTASPWLLRLKLFLAEWLVNHDILWPLNAHAPWWLLTNYPANNDSFNWLDGFCCTFYIVGSGLCFGIFLSSTLSLIAKICHKGQAFKHHLAQAYLPIAAAGLFLGLTATTIKLLQNDGIKFWWLDYARASLLAGASLWSLYLGARLIARYKPATGQWAGGYMLFSLSLVPVMAAWWFMFWGW